MSPTQLDQWAERVAASALALEPVLFGPWKGSMRSVSADQVPADYATTGTDHLFQPRDGTFKRRDGQSIKFDSATGLLPAKWGAKARHADQFESESFTDGLQSVACLFTKETVASGLDDGRFSNFWVRDQVNSVNYTVGAEYGSNSYAPAGTEQVYKIVPLWYQSGDGGITRGVDEFSRRFFFPGARRWLKAGNWSYFPSRLGTPSRWRNRFNRTDAASAATQLLNVSANSGGAIWDGSRNAAGVLTGNPISSGVTVNNDDTEWSGVNEGSGPGTNPQAFTVNGTIVPGRTYTCLVRVRTDSGTCSLSGHIEFRLNDSAGNQWVKSDVLGFAVDLTKDENGNSSPLTTGWRSYTFTITCSGTPAATGQTANTIVCGLVGTQTGPVALYIRCTYIQVSSGSGGTVEANRLIPSGPLPPTHCGTCINGDRINTEQKSPASDVSADAGWDTSPVSGGTRFSQLDDIPANDTDRVYRVCAGSEIKEFVVGMTSFAVTPTSGDVVRTVVRAAVGGIIGSATVRIQFLSGAGGTTRAGGDFPMDVSTTDVQTFTLTLTDAERAAITTAGEWATLRVRIVLFSNAVSAVFAVTNIINENTPAAATAGGGWRGKHQFMRAIAYRWEDGSVWMPAMPRFPNTTLTSGLGVTTVDANNPEQAYSFMRWQNLPIPPHGVTDLILMRTEKIDSTTEDVLTLNPFRLGVIAEVPAGTTTYDDYFPDDDSLTFDPSELVIRFDHMMPPRARYNFGGAQRVCHQNGSTNPCAITLAPVGLAADYDRNLADDSSTVYGSGSQYFFIYDDPTASPTQGMVLVKKTSGGTVTSLTFDLTAATATYATLQKLVDGINATAFGGNGGQWRAQLCPDVSGDITCAASTTTLNLTAHKRVIQSCVVSGQTITKAAGGLSKVAVGAKVSGTGVTAGAYVSRIDSDTQLTFVGTITPATITATFYFDTGDTVAIAAVDQPWAQRVIANSLPGFAYFSMTWLNTEPIKKATTWMTTASPGSTKAAPNCFSALADNEHTPPLDAGIGMGGGAVDNGFVVVFSKKRGAIKNSSDIIGPGNDSDFHLFMTNEGSGCTAWNTVAQGDRCVFVMANEGIFCCDLSGERLLSKRIHCHDPATGDFTFENPLGILASSGDTDGSYASARVVRGALWVCYRASGSTPNRVVVYPFTSGEETNGLRSMVHPDGEPYGWSVPLAYGTSPVLVFQQAPRSSSEGLHIYGMNDGNAGSTGDGRIDELETGTQDNSVDIAATLEFPWLRFSTDEHVSGQDMVIDHNSPSGSTGTMTFIRSFSATDTYALTPGTSSSLVVSSEPKFLPQAARVGANAVMLKWTQATGSSRTIRRVLLRVKRLKFFKGA